MSCAWLATMLDQEQLEGRKATITSHVQSVVDMDDRPGSEVAAELGGRYFLRYLMQSQVTEFVSGSTDRPHWVTPTAVSSADVVSWLALPAPKEKRQHVLLLDPAKIDIVRGPSWIRFGSGIEFYLPNGFPGEAVVEFGVIKVR